MVLAFNPSTLEAKADLSLVDRELHGETLSQKNQTTRTKKNYSEYEILDHDELPTHMPCFLSILCATSSPQAKVGT